MFSIGEALRFGWGIFKQHALFLIGLVLLVWGSVFVLQLLVSFLFPEHVMSPIAHYNPTAPQPEFSVIGLLWGIVFQVLSMLLTMGAIYITLEFVDGKTPRFADITAPWSNFLPYLAGTILYILIVIAGLILLIVPGIYFALKYQFVPYLIIDRKLGPIEALKKSAELTKGSKWKLLGFWVVIMLIVLAGFVALVVGALVAVPVTFLATAYVYRTLLRASEQESEPEAASAPAPEDIAPFPVASEGQTSTPVA